jgi:ubiquitin C-terminal hydrolase
MSYSSSDSDSSTGAIAEDVERREENLSEYYSDGSLVPDVPSEIYDPHETTYQRAADSFDDAPNLHERNSAIRSDMVLSPQTAQFDSSLVKSAAAPLSMPTIGDIALSIEQCCGKIDGYVLERHLIETSQCCYKILRSLYALNPNADIVAIDPLNLFQRFTDSRSIPFLAFPYIDLNHEVQLLDRLSRLCHAEMYTDYGNNHRKCVQAVSQVLSSRLLSLLQEYDLVSRCVESDAPFLAGSLICVPPFEVMPSLRSRSSSPVPMPSQNLGAKRAVHFANSGGDCYSGHAGRTSPVLEPEPQPVSTASLKPNSDADFMDEFPDRCCALLWGLKYVESDKLNSCRTCRCSEPALPDGRLCQRHSRIPKLHLFGTVPLDSFERLDQHRSHVDALKVIFPPSSAPDPNLYLKSVMKRLTMIVDRCRAMLTCSQRFQKAWGKALYQNEVNYHPHICENFSVFGKFASGLIFRIASTVADPLSFISGEHGCALSFIADPCKSFFLDGMFDANFECVNHIFASICDFTVASCRNLVDRIRNSPSTPTAAQAIFQSLDKLASCIKTVCLLWADFRKKFPSLEFPFGLMSSSMFLSSLLLYSPFSLPRVLASLDLLHSMATLMNCCHIVFGTTNTSELSHQFSEFIASIQNLKFTSAEDCESALSLFDSFLKTANATKECEVREGACPISVASTLYGSVFAFLNAFKMQNESAAGICALLRNAKCWARREEACRILVTFLAGSDESFNIDSILSILPWENRYDEDWVEVEALALQSMVRAAEARPQHLQGEFLQNSMKRILSCARTSAENQRSMCEVAIELLKVLASDGFPSAMFRSVLVQVDRELFSAGTPPNHDGMKLFLQIVDIIVNKFPDLIQEVTERWISTLKDSNSRFSVVSSAILLSSILRFRSDHENLFCVDFVIPKISELLSDSNDDAFFKLEDSVIHMLTLCRNIYVVQRSVPSVDQIEQLRRILSSSSSKIRDALYNTILSPALFYLSLTDAMLKHAPSASFSSTYLSLKVAFDYLLTMDPPDRTSYIRKFINDFCSSAVSALQSSVPEVGLPAEFSNLFKIQLCSWPSAVSDSKVPSQIAAVHNACHAGLLCLSTIIHPNCPVFFCPVPAESSIVVHGGDQPPLPSIYGHYPVANCNLTLTFESTSALLTSRRHGEQQELPLIPGHTECKEIRTNNQLYHSVEVVTKDVYIGPFHFRSRADLDKFRTEINKALQYCESATHFCQLCDNWQLSKVAAEADSSPAHGSVPASAAATSEFDVFSFLIDQAKSDSVVLRFLSSMFALVMSSHGVQKPLLLDALSKYSQLLRGDDIQIEIAFLVIRQALHSFPSVGSFGFSFLLSNPYFQEVQGAYNAQTFHTNPPTFKIFHASQIFKTTSKYVNNWAVEYHADISGETFFSCVDLIPETGMPQVFPLTQNNDVIISCARLSDFKKAEKLKPTPSIFYHMMTPLNGTDFGQELRTCALRLVSSSWSNPSGSSVFSSRPEVSDLAADILALLPASRSLEGIGRIEMNCSLQEAIISCDVADVLNDISNCIEDERILPFAVQSISVYERVVFKLKAIESWPLRLVKFCNSSGVHLNDAALKSIPRFISKCVDCIGRQSFFQSKFLLSGISSALRSHLSIMPYAHEFDGAAFKLVLIKIHQIFANPRHPSAIQVSTLNSYPSSGYIRHDLICNFVDCVASLLRLKLDNLFSDFLDLVGPLMQAKIFPKYDEHLACDLDVPDAVSSVTTDSVPSLWLTSEEMFTLCFRLNYLFKQYQLPAYEYDRNVDYERCSSMFAAMMHLCAQAGIGCSSRTAAVTSLLTKIILPLASSTAGHASPHSTARLVKPAKDVLSHCRRFETTKHVIPLLVDTVMRAFCSISLDDDFRESSLGECFEILRVVLYIIQDERDCNPSSPVDGQPFQEENVIKTFQKSLDLLTALFDSKTSRSSMISTKVCELLLKVITSFDDLLSPRIFVEKLFLIHEIAEQRRHQLALPVKSVVVTIQDSKKHSLERVNDAHTCSSCNVTVQWADLCNRCSKCASCSSSEPQCIQLRQAHGWSGLTNIGNTCFMNAVLQQAAAIPWVVNSVLFAKPKPALEPSEAVDVSSAPIPAPRATPSLLVEFQKLVAEMLYSNSGVVGTREFAGASKFEGESLIIGQQQDAGSYFRSFIDQIEGDLNDIKRQEWRNLFFGSIQTQTIRKCHTDEDDRFITTKSEDVFGEILLSVTGKKNLQECIAARLSAGERQVHCEHCAKSSTASTQDSFLKLPPILICQFHRASADGSKCLDRPSFPYQSTLDLSSFMSPDSLQQSCLYELQGIVLHKGESVRSGHYISIIRERATHPCSRLGSTVDKDPQWWMMNDETVTAVSRDNLHELCSFDGLPCSDVHEALPYLLIFTRKHTRGPSAPRSFSSALDRVPAGIQDSSLPFDIFDSETPAAETPSASAFSQVSDNTPSTEGFTRRKSEGTGAYVKGENFVARLDTVLQHSEGRVPLLSDGSQFVFQNILKRHDARVQSILLCHSYSNLIERMLKRVHEQKPSSTVRNLTDLKIGDHVINERDHQKYECIGFSGQTYCICKPLSGGAEREISYWYLQIVPKPAPIEDVRAVHWSLDFLHFPSFLFFNRYSAWAPLILLELFLII